MPTYDSSNSLSSTSSSSSNSSPEVITTPTMSPSMSLNHEDFEHIAIMLQDGTVEFTHEGGGVIAEDDEFKFDTAVVDEEDCVSCRPSCRNDGDNRSLRAVRSLLEGRGGDMFEGDIALPPAKGLAGFMDRIAPL
jgi:hypothetical protein